MQLPPSKDFPPGELLGWAVFVEKGMLQEWLCYDDVCDVDVGAPRKLVFGVPYFKWPLRFGVWGTVYHGLRRFSIRRSVTVVGGA